VCVCVCVLEQDGVIASEGDVCEYMCVCVCVCVCWSKMA
jgi:hypothetical protein